MTNASHQPRQYDTIRDITELLTYVENDAVTSKSCLHVGVLTKTAKQISEFLTEPAKSILSAYNSMGNGLSDLVSQIVKHYLVANKQLIEKAYRMNSHSLEYFIVLKEDDFTAREKFFKFLEHYEGLEFAQQFPVMFQFMPATAIGKIDSKNEVRLN
jgi:hypothetical protein